MRSAEVAPRAIKETKKKDFLDLLPFIPPIHYAFYRGLIEEEEEGGKIVWLMRVKRKTRTVSVLVNDTVCVSCLYGFRLSL